MAIELLYKEVVNMDELKYKEKAKEIIDGLRKFYSYEKKIIYVSNRLEEFAEVITEEVEENIDVSDILENIEPDRDESRD